MSAASVPAPIHGLCECCQARPVLMLVYLPAADSCPVAAPHPSGDRAVNPQDYFRICGAACDLPEATGGPDAP